MSFGRIRMSFGALSAAGAMRRFGRDRKGATAVEFALVGVPFFAVVFAVFELGFINLQNGMLDNAVNDAARAMLTGRLQTAGISSTQQFITQYFCQATSRTLPASFNCANLIVDVRPAATFVAGNTANDFYKNTTNQFCPGQAGQIMVVRVAYPLRAVFPLNLLSPSTGVVNDVPNLPGNYHILMGAALFQEENYSGAYTPPAGC